jgi:hypothetical protein
LNSSAALFKQTGEKSLKFLTWFKDLSKKPTESQKTVQKSVTSV